MTIAFNPHLAILPLPQRALWPELRLIPPQLVLYGGTAIALRLGHRQSIDFDFFCFCDLEHDRLLNDLALLKDAQTLQRERNTLSVLLDRDGPVRLSFFGVPKLRQVRTPDQTLDNKIHVASLLDLASTKASDMQVRAELKDYVDLDVILQGTEVDLAKALGAARAIYGASFNPQITLKALSYFDDGNLRDLPAEVRDRLAAAARTVDLDSLPIFELTAQP
jgi:Nucleotidyl transferase AbiEii toxin, Type IV TA system